MLRIQRTLLFLSKCFNCRATISTEDIIDGGEPTEALEATLPFSCLTTSDSTLGPSLLEAILHGSLSETPSFTDAATIALCPESDKHGQCHCASSCTSCSVLLLVCKNAVTTIEDRELRSCKRTLHRRQTWLHLEPVIPNLRKEQRP